MAETPAPAIAARRAEALAARLPPLLVAAERVAATVAQGVHGRRRVGQGESFWQFRHYVSGDPVARIDWRQSAKSGRPAPDGWFLRETEWEAAQTVCLWCDGSPSMRWHSRHATVQKRERAALLTLALASLLLRGGERVLLMTPGARAVGAKSSLDRLAVELDGDASESGLPPRLRLPRHASIVLISDFLAPLPDLATLIGGYAALPATGFLLQVLDPAEVALPYDGRVRFRGVERDGETLVPRVEAVRGPYVERMQAQQEGLRALAAAAGFGFGLHRTDHPPEPALLTLYAGLGGR